MPKLRYPLIWLMLIAMSLSPQVAYAGWFRSYGGDEYDSGKYLLELDDGSFMVLGTTASQGAGNTDIWLLKVNTDGDTVWSRTYGGSGYDDAFSIQPVVDSGFVILGGTGSIDTGGVWLIRIDSQGEVLWSRTYGGYYDSYSSPLLKVGEDQTITFTDWKRFMKVNGAGDVILTKTYDECWGEYYDIDCANSTSDGGYILYSANGYPDPMIKVDKDGEIIRGLDEFIPLTNRIGYIREGHRGYLYVGDTWGEGSDSIPNSDMITAEVDTIHGEPFWITGDGWPITDEFGYCIKPTQDSGYIVAGEPCTLLKLGDYDEYTQSIEHEWMRDYDCNPYYVELTTDGGYIVVGEKDEDLFLVKTDSMGLLGIEEPVTPPVTPVTHQFDWQVVTAVGPEIVIRYSNSPGFSTPTIVIYDALGRKVDEVHSTGQSGTLTWGECYGPGVYFIKPADSNSKAQKVILLR